MYVLYVCILIDKISRMTFRFLGYINTYAQSLFTVGAKKKFSLRFRSTLHDVITEVKSLVTFT